MTQYEVNELETELNEARRADRKPVFHPEDNALVVSVHRNDEDMEVHDLIEYSDHPRRKKGFVTVRTADAFADYVNKHKVPGQALIVADKDKVTAVLNHHTESSLSSVGTAGWGDFGVKLELQYTPQWSGWTGFANKYLDQEDLANWLEENALDIIDPPGGDLLDIVANLRLASNSQVSRRINLQNGAVQWFFAEDFQPVGGGANDAGSIIVPSTFKISVQCFHDGPEYEIPMLLRYRVKDMKVQWLFRFTGEYRKIFDEAFDQMTATISAATNERVYRGSLPA